MPLHAWIRPALRWSGLGLLLLASGCATHTASKGGHDFGPSPKAETQAHLLTPVKFKEVKTLLNQADEAWRLAQAAEERGDTVTAARQRKLMLDLLSDAEVDANTFRALHDAFAEAGHENKLRASLYQNWAEGVYVPESDKEIRVPQPLPDRVRKELDLIQRAYPKPFQRGLDRSAKYLPYVRAELAKAGLPQELAWVIMVESQFTPKILSCSNAGGMWQFMRDTAARYDLRMDTYVDERFNWRSSTQAAIVHFRNLQNFFQGSWPLAITAYNMGEFGLDRVIAATGGERNLWTLLDTPPASERIAQETKQYYAKYLASLIVVKDPERYGFKIATPAPEEIVQVPVNDMYALEDLNQSLGLAPGTLAQLNPDLIQEVTPPNGAYAITIPAGAQEKFQVALEKTPQLRYGPRYYKLRKGESFDQIASKYGLTSKDLLKLNGLRSAKKVKAGQTLRVPAGFYHAGEELLAAELTEEPKEPETRNTADDGELKFHVVKAGEWPEKIAQAYGLPVDEFYTLNNIDDKAVIHEGDKLIVGKTEKPKKAATSGKNAKQQDAGKQSADTEDTAYEVAKGDTAGKIAAKQGVALKDLLAWNHLKESDVLPLGKKLALHAPAKTEEVIPAHNDKIARAKTEKTDKAEPAEKPQPKKQALKAEPSEKPAEKPLKTATAKSDQAEAPQAKKPVEKAAKETPADKAPARKVAEKTQKSAAVKNDQAETPQAKKPVEKAAKETPADKTPARKVAEKTQKSAAVKNDKAATPQAKKSVEKADKETPAEKTPARKPAEKTQKSAAVKNDKAEAPQAKKGVEKAAEKPQKTAKASKTPSKN